MIEKVTMYTVFCDNCGEDVGENSEYSCWHDESQARDSAIDSDWQTEDDKNNNEKHYCPKCVVDTDEKTDKLIIDTTRTKAVAVTAKDNCI